MASRFSQCLQFLRALMRDPLPIHKFPGPHNFTLNICSESVSPVPRNGKMTEFLDSLKDGFLWNTPKKRKSIEWRLTSRFGSLQWGTSKIIRMNKLLRVEHKTGDFFELGRLAPTHYKRVMDETKEIKKKIAGAFQVGKPKDQEVTLRYSNDKGNENVGNRIVVEMEKERPAFFSRNLVTKTRTPESSAAATTVRPSGLG